MEKLLCICVIVLSLTGVPGMENSTFKDDSIVPKCEAKTYYDWNDGSFKSVNETSGQTFDYSTGEYGQDYSR